MCDKCQVGYGYDYMIFKRTIITLREVLTMFEDKIEAMNKLPNAVDDSSGFEKEFIR